MRALVVATLLAAGPAARADDLTVDPATSVVRFHVGYALHKVHGEVHQIVGRARLPEAGPAQVMVRIPAVAFTTGNSNRDAHMREVIESARHPAVELKAVVPDFPRPTTFPATVDVKLQAQLSFHGVRHALDIPVRLLFTAPHKLHATTKFTIRLTTFQIPLPSLLFVPIDDEVRLEAELDLK